MIENITTIRSAIQWVHQQFQQSDIFLGHGNDDLWDEAVFLTLHCVGLPLDSEVQVLDDLVTASQHQKIKALTHARIKERIPLAYLIKRAWFAGLEFYVDERVLIPRSPIAELVEHEFAPWVIPHQIHRVLDLCTGSGCIGIATAHYMTQVSVDLCDICQDALDVAQKNIDRYQLQDRVRTVRSDVFSHIQNLRYDLIVSNPPYVDQHDIDTMPDEFRHEPIKGLAAGVDGLDIVRRILVEVADHLTDNGILIVEVGNSQQTLMALYPDVPFTWLEFARGGDGVFLLSCEQLKQHFGHQ